MKERTPLGMRHTTTWGSVDTRNCQKVKYPRLSCAVLNLQICGRYFGPPRLA